MPFPTLAPSSRLFTERQFPVKSYQAQNGFEARLLYGNRGFGRKLELTYTAIRCDQAERFMRHWAEMKGTWEAFKINLNGTNANDGILAGDTGEKTSILGDKDEERWRFAGPPEFTSVFRGLVTVRIQLISTLV